MSFTQGYALIIGVGADLPTTVNDAEGLADIVRDEARCAYPQDQVHVLTSKQATRDQILAALDRLAQTTDAQSTVIVYFSGHGYRATSTMGESYYLMPYGYNLQRLYQTAISGNEFASRLRTIPAQKLVLLLDCCHAGGVGAVKGLELTKASLPPEAQQLLAEGHGRVLIASSREDELSYAGKPYSAFTLALIEALCGVGVAKEDGYVRVADLALHTREVVPGRTKDQQHPVLHFEQADNFVLAYYAGGDTQLKELRFIVEPQIEPEPGAWTSERVQQSVSGTGAVGIMGAVRDSPITTGSHNNITHSGRDTVQAGGNVTQTGGDYVRGDKISVGDVRGNGIAIGRNAQAYVQQDRTEEAFAHAFSQIYTAIQTRRPDPGVDKGEIIATIKDIEQEARKGDSANVGKLTRWLRSLGAMAEDIFNITVTVLIGSHAASATVAQKVAAKVKQERAQNNE